MKAERAANRPANLPGLEFLRRGEDFRQHSFRRKVIEVAVDFLCRFVFRKLGDEGIERLAISHSLPKCLDERFLRFEHFSGITIRRGEKEMARAQTQRFGKLPRDASQNRRDIPLR